MTIAETARAPQRSNSKEFEPGSTGWLVAELDDNQVENLWVSGRFELIHGILTRMPPAKYTGTNPTGRLVMLLSKFDQIQAGNFQFEIDLEIAPDTVLRPDACWLSKADRERNRIACFERGLEVGGRFLVPPTLIIESVSVGHERHDRISKSKWYADFGVPHFWIVDGFQKQLECYTLKSGSYSLSAKGQGDETVVPDFFVPVQIPLDLCWAL